MLVSLSCSPCLLPQNLHPWRLDSLLRLLWQEPYCSPTNGLAGNLLCRLNFQVWMEGSYSLWRRERPRGAALKPVQKGKSAQIRVATGLPPAGGPDPGPSLVSANCTSREDIRVPPAGHVLLTSCSCRSVPCRASTAHAGPASSPYAPGPAAPGWRSARCRHRCAMAAHCR